MMHRLGALGILSAIGIMGCDGDPGRAEAVVSDGTRPVGVGKELDARDEAGRELHFRVDGVEKNREDADGDVSFYELSVRDASGEWARYCTPDYQGKSRAIPVKGSWDEHGAYIAGSAGKTTFACTSGAIGKCIRFGYKPWKTVEGQSLLPQHQACVHMVRADYCGNGTPHTKDGTRIDIFDPRGIQKRDELTADHPEVFEAAWGPEGAVYLSVPRWSEDVASVVAECPEKLRGRTSLDERLDPSQVAQKYSDALVFNGRYVKDADRWHAVP